MFSLCRTLGGGEPLCLGRVSVSAVQQQEIWSRSPPPSVPRLAPPLIWVEKFFAAAAHIGVATPHRDDDGGGGGGGNELGQRPVAACRPAKASLGPARRWAQ